MTMLSTLRLQTASPNFSSVETPETPKKKNSLSMPTLPTSNAVLVSMKSPIKNSPPKMHELIGKENSAPSSKKTKKPLFCLPKDSVSSTESSPVIKVFSTSSPDNSPEKLKQPKLHQGLLEPRSLLASFEIEKPVVLDIHTKVVGRELNPREQKFADSLLESVQAYQDLYFCQQLFSRLKRGTYVVSIFDPKTCTTSKKIGLVIAQYLGFDESHPDRQFHFPYAFGEPLAVVKPDDEVRGGRNHLTKEHEINHQAMHGIRPEDEITNEVIAASLFPLSQPVLAVTMPGPFNYNYLRGHPTPKRCAAIGHLTGMTELTNVPDIARTLNSISARDFQQMAIMDIALCNTDRNLGNIMIDPKTGKLGLIDHALILPQAFKSPGVFAWMTGAKAHIPFNRESLRQIDKLNWESDSAKILRDFPDYPSESLQTMRITYHLLKTGARYKLTPFQIACFLTGNSNDYRQMPMEVMYEKAKKLAQNNPDKTYALMTKCIDKAIKDLRANLIPQKMTIQERFMIDGKIRTLRAKIRNSRANPHFKSVSNAPGISFMEEVIKDLRGQIKNAKKNVSQVKSNNSTAIKNTIEDQINASINKFFG